MGNKSSNHQICTWCRGKRYVRRPLNLSQVPKLRGMLLISLTGGLFIWAAMGELHGWWAIIAIVILVLAFIIQLILELAEVKHLILGRKVPCPRCSRESSDLL